MFTKLSVPMAMMALSQADGSKVKPTMDSTIDKDDVVQGHTNNLDMAVGGTASMFKGLIGFKELAVGFFDPFENVDMDTIGVKNSKNPTGCPNWRTINAKCNNYAVDPSWGTAGEFMPRSVGGNTGNSGASTTDAGRANVYDSGRWATMGGPNSWGGHDPRMVSNRACSNINLSYSTNDWSTDGGIPVGNDGARGDSVITYAQVMDHELDATGPTKAYSTASDNGTKYKFGQNEDGKVQGSLERTHDSAKNGITSYVDAGILYGESADERQKLRWSGSLMRYTCLEQSNPTTYCGYKSQYLPISSQICGKKTCDPKFFFMANPTKRGCFYAGDFRANENPALVAYHTLFLRMHNYYATSIYSGGGSFLIGGGACNSSFDGANTGTSSCTFEKIRHRVGYEEQFITYDEWMPAYTGTWFGGSYYKIKGKNKKDPVLGFSKGGVGGMPFYTFYDKQVRGSVRHIFATATFRQHTGVNHTMKLQNGGELELDQTYFESCVWVGAQGPGCSSQQVGGGKDSDIVRNGIRNLCDILAGQTTQLAKKGDTEMITEERNQLMYKASNFGNDSADEIAGSFEGFGGDLASLNIFRGRDHNIAGYRNAFSGYFTAAQGPQAVNEIHTYHGLSGTGSNGSIDLSSAYKTLKHVDVWTGALGEAKLNNPNGGTSMLGAMLTFDVVTQFRDLRDGDRFFYGNGQLGAYGAPAWSGNPDKKGLNGWTNQLTGSSIGGRPFGLAKQASCKGHTGKIRNHASTFFDSNTFECGSGGTSKSYSDMFNDLVEKGIPVPPKSGPGGHHIKM